MGGGGGHGHVGVSSLPRAPPAHGLWTEVEVRGQPQGLQNGGMRAMPMPSAWHYRSIVRPTVTFFAGPL
jgi:hypothetical protein